jgi:hypothetical protein
MDRTAYNDILEANLNNNLQEHDDIDQQIKIITDTLIDAQKTIGILMFVSALTIM